MQPMNHVTRCLDCARGVPKSANGSNHIFGEQVGDFRPCLAFDLEAARSLAQVYADATRVPYAVFKMPSGQLAVSPAVAFDGHPPPPVDWEFQEQVKPQDVSRATFPSERPAYQSAGDTCTNCLHVVEPEQIHVRKAWAICLAGKPGEPESNGQLLTAGEAPRSNTSPPVRRAGGVHIWLPPKREPDDPFETSTGNDTPNCCAPGCQLLCFTWQGIEVHCDNCGQPLCFPHWKSAPEQHSCAGKVSRETSMGETLEGEQRLSLELEYDEQPAPPQPAHALTIKWLGSEAGTFEGATEMYASCTCGEWENCKMLDTVTSEASNREFAEQEFQRHVAAVHDVEPEAATSKKEQILALFESGTTDIAQIVRRVAARPSYVAQVLQSAGHLTSYFDLYTTTDGERNVYSRFFRNVLSFKNVEASRESIQKIDRLYNYFERLGDRAGQHQAMVLALTGKNRARWSGKIEESEVFSEWLNSH